MQYNEGLNQSIGIDLTKNLTPNTNLPGTSYAAPGNEKSEHVSIENRVEVLEHENGQAVAPVVRITQEANNAISSEVEAITSPIGTTLQRLEELKLGHLVVKDGNFKCTEKEFISNLESRYIDKGSISDGQTQEDEDEESQTSEEVDKVRDLAADTTVQAL
ncbi:PREDICTED: uncharacterized protein LOC105976405 isoform X2 [Erythranthe guttata]|uniref:uncharacterized protein LOC105976405 isoform X1 n=1 Tax=Erythranthe guttata TaxID=4155 RepID=UPI00064DBE3B|nr:PREDICTED: uncharacterized protein LOC105976405 isoform X1 [Erythranthe guttata]XP_012857131.1 PREDICTED: uncharacterized protein LOC105976405 isoform X2 [Erythranthe guttata]|eukprot:XP_012857130.1 PREDICTED: uncharacterized protein LOC105976405 isoform X1 [Erythranthe guttata]